MSKLEEVRQLLERAEQLAMGGDFVSAEELLKGAATIQEQELGPRHPDLANTLNNLAIVAEKTGRTREAETLYRRAASIAATALPSDHPMVVETRQNLEDFCRAHGVPVHPPSVAPKPDPPPPAPAAPKPLEPAAASEPLPPATASEPLPPAAAAGKPSHLMAWLTIGAILAVALVIFLVRARPPRESSTPLPTPEPSAAQPAATGPPPTGAPPPSSATIDQPSSPKAAPREPHRQGTANVPSARGAVTLAIAEVCRNFSTSSSRWRCDPVGASAAPGRLVLYTRVKSPRDTTVVHRWYHGNALRQSVRLGIQGNATEGYRTYSRQTVTDGDWRVEVRSADGAILHEERFVVR
jgi:tetratricopeptide repeat protein/DUF2914 family protein